MLICWEDMSLTTVVPRKVNTFFLNHGEVKYITSIYAPSHMKGDVTKCTNNPVIALFPHAKKVLLRIYLIQTESFIGYETPK